MDYQPYIRNLNIESLNEMQLAVIEAAETKNDIIVMSNTGSGKTLAFLLPLIASLNPDIKGTQALIISPSRELALQIEDVFKRMGTGKKITCCYGGHKREIEENNLIEAPTVIVGTPGRLGDHLRRGNIKTNNIHFLVLDEFDKTLELGFQEEVGYVVGEIPDIKQRILTSATQSVAIPRFLNMQNTQMLDFVKPDEDENKTIFEYLKSEEPDKIESLVKLLSFIGNRSTIIFCNHRDAVERTSELLKEKGIITGFYHGAMEQRDREQAISKFRNGTYNFLVTTDLASRGLDIPNVRYIIHYHLPDTEQTYTHRNGRTARMDKSGNVTIILGPDEKLPGFIEPDIQLLEINGSYPIPDKPKWGTLFIGAGKKDKVNKIDIVGFLSKKGMLKPEDIGVIEVKDFYAFAAVRKNLISGVLATIKGEKVKGKKVNIEIAR